MVPFFFHDSTLFSYCQEERERAERRLVLLESAEAAAAVQEHFNQSLLLAEQKVSLHTAVHNVFYDFTGNIKMLF